MTELETLGRRVREARLARRVSQAELGRQVRVDPSLIRHVEAGRMVAYPRLRREIARVLQVPMRSLFDEPG